ncbi:MAG: TetR/AcrR family transcriptional regulator [Boseongicola sp. SB0675_bin_26]|nr:TetR/AcrR family transcriptional regulator [Boseongicola sp. SB0675_bin_26]
MQHHDFQRARSEEQVQQRRDDIINAARALLETSGSGSVTLMSIGKGVGLAKSNIYRYFESREDILCEVFLQESEKLADEHWSAFNGMPRLNDLSTCAAVFANGCAARPLFCMLHAELAGTMEEHVSVERLIYLKTEFARLMARVASGLQAAAPELGEARACLAVRMFLHQLAGCWLFSHLGDRPNEAIRTARLAQFSQPFRKTYSQSCYVILTGLSSIDISEDMFSGIAPFDHDSEAASVPPTQMA